MFNEGICEQVRAYLLFFIGKYIEIIFFYFLKFIFNSKTLNFLKTLKIKILKNILKMKVRG